MKSCAIIGGGYSINDGIQLGLWDKLKKSNIEIWSVNSAFKAMPFLPTREIWVDVNFFRHGVVELQKLYDQGVILMCKKHNHYTFLGDRIKQFECCRQREFYKEGMKTVSHVFIGGHGLSGIFALSLAVLEDYNICFALGFDWGSPSNEIRKTHFYQDKFPIITNLNDSKNSENEIYSHGAGKPGIYLREDNKPNRHIKDFDLFLNEKMKIYNVSPSSNLYQFEKIDYPTFFKILEEKNEKEKEEIREVGEEKKEEE